MFGARRGGGIRKHGHLTYSNAASPAVGTGTELPDERRLLSLLLRQGTSPPPSGATVVRQVGAIRDRENGLVQIGGSFGTIR